MMDKGIRPFAVAKFGELLPQFASKTLTGTQFRAHVNVAIMEAFNVSMSAAATAYNHAKHEYSKKPEHAAALVGLGRPPEKNNGGRKPKQAEAPKVLTPEEIEAQIAALQAQLAAARATPETPVLEGAPQGDAQPQEPAAQDAAPQEPAAEAAVQQVEEPKAPEEAQQEPVQEPAVQEPAAEVQPEAAKPSSKRKRK